MKMTSTLLRRFYGLLFSAFIVSFTASASDGWQALLENRDADAEQAFLEEIAERPDDPRPWFGLSLIETIRFRDSAAGGRFAEGLSRVKDPHPWIYASIYSSRLQSLTEANPSAVEDILKGVVDRPDRYGILRAMAYEQLGSIAESRGDVKSARSWYTKIGAITTWRLVGPFPNISSSGHDRKFEPEVEDVPNAVYEGPSGGEVRWIEPGVARLDSWIDMVRYYPTTYGQFYAITYVWSPKEQRVFLRLGTSGSYKLFVNGTIVDESADEHNNDLDTYINEITLGSGWNRILVKVGSSEISRCNFLLRITDESGDPVQDLKVSADVQQPSTTLPNPRPIANPFIQFFQERIEQNPNALDDAIFLSDCHLRNDQADAAERVLRPWARAYPDAIVIMFQLIDAYRRGRKDDDQNTLVERIATLRPDLAISVITEFYRSLSNDKLDEAEDYLKKLAVLMPETQTYYSAAITIASRRNRLQERNDLNVKAFERYPRNIGFMRDNVVQAIQSQGRYDAAIKIVNHHLSFGQTENGLLLLAALHLEAGRQDEWRKIWQKLFERAPGAPGYHISMADVYSSRKEYDSAIYHVRAALDVAPTSSPLWFKAGTLYGTRFDKESAQKAFRTALALDPANFDAREALRELEGQPHPFTTMPKVDIDSLITTAPPSSDYPEDAAIYLLDDRRRVVYNGSRSEVLYETVIRILKTEGIDAFKEYRLPYAGDGNLILEKAVVRKRNGREVTADGSGGMLVFKQLEIGDIIHVKAKVRESRGGRLARYFWDDVGLNGFYPVRLARYSLLVPRSTNLRWTVANGAGTPVIQDRDDGTLYFWETKDDAAIEYEEGMPSYEVIGKRVAVTSIPGWNELVVWYDEIARPKTRTSLEVAELMDSLFPRNREYTTLELIDGVYRFITSTIRYSNVPFRQSGIIPQKARDVLVTRIGDCKDVATLCISMLAERNVKAWHVLVETRSSELVPNRLPSIPFDHAIVCLYINDTLRFFDLTADDVPLGSVPVADLDAFALPIVPGWKEPIRLSRSLFLPNNINITTKVTFTPEGDAIIDQTNVHSGARTQYYRSAWKEATPKEIEKGLLEMLSNEWGGVTLESYEMTGLDTLSPTFSYRMVYTVPSYLVEAGDFRMARLQWYDGWGPDPALSYTKRIHPYEFGSDRDTVREVLQITIPSNYEASGLTKRFERSHQTGSVVHTAETNNNTVTLTRTSVFSRDYVLPHEYDSYKSFYNDVVRRDRAGVLFVPKGTVVRSPKQKR